ncbi:MAG: hypothetical protein ACRDFB_03015 [Rhabdochlamydiaceae bacterium]
MSSVNACLAAISIKDAIKMKNLTTKSALTKGSIELVKINNVDDILGEPVNKCTRLLSKAKPNQILIDDVIFKSDRSWLKNIKKFLKISKEHHDSVKNYQDITYYEICASKSSFVGFDSKM